MTDIPQAPMHWIASTIAAAAVCTVSSALAQDASPAGPSRVWSFEPSASLRQTFTDNRDLSDVKRSEAITEATGSMTVRGNRGPLRGSLDYSLTGTLHARDSGDNELRHFLGAAATAEVIDGIGFVDVRGNYSQQAISAFGTQSTDAALDNRNSTDVGSLFVSPYLRGRLGGAILYEARASARTTRAKDTDASDVDERSVLLRLNTGETPSRLGWFADARRNIVDYRAGRRTFDSRARVGLTYRFGPDWRIGANVGKERTDIAIPGGESTSTWGLEADWTPSPRTSMNAAVEDRFFGLSHSLRFAHRTPSTAWALSSSRDLSSYDRQGIGSFGSAYDLFFRQFASSEPDEIKRDLLVRDYLRSNGIDSRAVVIGGFLSSAVTLTNAQSASVALVGVRNTLTFRLTASRQERADRVATVLDDLSLVEEVRQHGALVDWSFRLSPISSLGVAAAYQRSTSDVTSQRNTLKSITATWRAQLGPRTTATAGARHAEFDSPSSPYDENAIFAAVRMSF
jgi:uncharacterized protein (PEP-CTERM system associated)